MSENQKDRQVTDNESSSYKNRVARESGIETSNSTGTSETTDAKKEETNLEEDNDVSDREKEHGEEHPHEIKTPVAEPGNADKKQVQH